MPHLARLARSFFPTLPGARWALVALAVLLLLNAADPTPRFVGLPLAHEQGPDTPASPSSHRGSENYNLPDGVSVRSGPAAFLSLLFHRPPEIAASDPGGAFGPGPFLALDAHRLSFAERQGPPLRC